jgi:hypothetical protein
VSPVAKAFDLLGRHRDSCWIEAKHNDRYFRRTTLAALCRTDGIRTDWSLTQDYTAHLSGNREECTARQPHVPAGICLDLPGRRYQNCCQESAVWCQRLSQGPSRPIAESDRYPPRCKAPSPRLRPGVQTIENCSCAETPRLRKSQLDLIARSSR